MLCVVLFGCTNITHNAGRMEQYAVPDEEAEWIQQGNPIKFDGEVWHPQDNFDVLLDSEVYFKGQYNGVPFFVEKIDVQPYNKVFTKFGRNKFRIYRAMEDE